MASPTRVMQQVYCLYRNKSEHGEPTSVWDDPREKRTSFTYVLCTHRYSLRNYLDLLFVLECYIYQRKLFFGKVSSDLVCTFPGIELLQALPKTKNKISAIKYLKFSGMSSRTRLCIPCTATFYSEATQYFRPSFIDLLHFQVMMFCIASTYPAFTGKV